jgi:hypothetical protein
LQTVEGTFVSSNVFVGQQFAFPCGRQ